MLSPHCQVVMLTNPPGVRYLPTGPETTIQQAAVRLFEVFASAPAPAVDGYRCHHCVSDADVAALAGDPRALSPEVASRFVRKVGTTWGGPEDLRRVAPRLVTLAADHQLPISRAVLWEKLRWAEWNRWPAPEVQALRQFLEAEWLRLIRARPRPAHAAHRWLADVGHGINDLRPFLDRWHDLMGALPPPEVQATAIGHLVELLTSSPLRPDLPATMIDVFPGNHLAADQLTHFLVGPGTTLELRRAASAATAAGAPGARRITVAVERLRRFRAAVEGPDAPPG